MEYLVSKNFQKQFKKLPKKTKNKAVEQLGLFVVDPMDYRLRNHPLTGEWAGYRSIDITNDYRAVYRLLDENIAFFKTVDNHNNLYK